MTDRLCRSRLSRPTEKSDTRKRRSPSRRCSRSLGSLARFLPARSSSASSLELTRLTFVALERPARVVIRGDDYQSRDVAERGSLSSPAVVIDWKPVIHPSAAIRGGRCVGRESSLSPRARVSDIFRLRFFSGIRHTRTLLLGSGVSVFRSDRQRRTRMIIPGVFGLETSVSCETGRRR